MSEKIPTGWSLNKFSDLIGSEGLISDGDWIESKDQDPKGVVRLVQLADIGDGNFINKSNRYMTHKKSIELRTTKLKKNDILIARMPEPIGRACLFPGLNQESVTVVDVTIVRSSKSNPYWLMASINQDAIRTEIQNKSGGSTRVRITRSELENLEIAIPPLIEQQKIATILTSVDEIIDNTQNQINKLEDLKRATMNELLTRGIGHTEFKDSEIGKVPECWTTGPFEKYITLQRGFDLPTQYRKSGKIPIYGSNGVVGFHDESKVSENGVITGRSGSIGHVYFVPNQSWALNTTLYVKNFHDNNHKFIYYFLKFFNLTRFSTGTGVPTLNRNIVHNRIIAFPPISEQNSIVNILDAIDNRLENAKNLLEVYFKLKKSLMNDLLTGKVRVEV